MRQLKEINEDIDKTTLEISFLQDRKERLMIEKNDRIFSDFCEKYGVKRGDIVELSDRSNFQVEIEGADGKYSPWIVCHKIGKNGNPHVHARYIRPDSFAGCKIIKSKED